MNYNEIVDDILADYQHPCDAEVPQGSYRRVMWEKYNTTLAQKGPAVQEEWDTEIILITKRVYDKNPFGLKSEPLPVVMLSDPEGNPVHPKDKCTGVWSDKIGHCFASQTELENYVRSIGSTLLPGNNWYGADLSKQSLFKHARELELYRLENTGAIWTEQGPKVDRRTCMRYSNDTKAVTLIDFNNVQNGRSAYLKHYDDHSKPCTYVGMKINTNPDLSIPGVPVAPSVSVDPLPTIYQAICIPAMFGFPYTNIAKSMIDSWNKTKFDYKISFDLPGLTKGVGDRIATVYDNLSISMQELGNAVLASSQLALQLAFAKFKEIISTALNIVGGGWDMLKRFLPSVSILGVNVDILELCTDPNGVQKLKEQLPDTDECINSIYKVIGSAYDYSIEFIRVRARDIVDAITDLYDWAWANLQYAGVALCKLLGELAQIWSIPPEVPNPVWLAIRAVRELFKQIPPLDLIMSGNFPGFTASELYDFCMKRINEERERVLALVDSIKQRITDTYESMVELKKELAEKIRYYHQYLKGMWERVTEETTRLKEKEISDLESDIQNQATRIKDMTLERFNLLDSINNVYEMGLNFLKQMPIVQTINDLLGLAGVGIDDLMNVIQNVETGLSTLYENFVEGCRNLKDTCKTIYNQVCTLALSKVTQWVNKLLSILSLVLEYPMMSICAPLLAY